MPGFTDKPCIFPLHRLQVDCNNHACNWDGTDCSYGINPWINCTVTTVRCWELYSNGECDEICNNRECIYDGFDCEGKLPECK